MKEMNAQFEKINIIVKYGVIAFFFIFLPFSADAETYDPQSLFSYTGYLTTPSAYITEAQFSLHYSYFSFSYPINKRLSQTKSEIWIFSSCLGLLPFLECFFSVYVTPSININDIIPNYGANKWRSGGIKLKLLKEKRVLPAFAVGLTDPDIGKLGASISSPNVMSSYVVLSKHYGSNKSSVSIGYGFEEGSYARLKKLFGGCNVALKKNISLLVDYDGNLWNGGLNIHWKKISLMFSVSEGFFVASRIGYGFNLLED